MIKLVLVKSHVTLHGMRSCRGNWRRNHTLTAMNNSPPARPGLHTTNLREELSTHRRHARQNAKAQTKHNYPTKQLSLSLSLSSKATPHAGQGKFCLAQGECVHHDNLLDTQGRKAAGKNLQGKLQSKWCRRGDMLSSAETETMTHDR